MFHLLWNIRHFYDGPDGAGPGPAPSSVCDCCEPGVVVGQHPDCVKALWEVGITFILITIMMTRMVMTFTQTDDDGDNDDDALILPHENDHHNDQDDLADKIVFQVAQRTAAKLAPRFESPDEMSDEEEILFDDIYEVIDDDDFDDAYDDDAGGAFSSLPWESRSPLSQLHYAGSDWYRFDLMLL